MGIEYILVDKDDPRPYELRYNVFCEEEDYLINKNIERVESDDYDKCAMHLLATDEGKPVGTLRVILENKMRDLESHCFGFAMEETYDLSNLKQKNLKLLENSRFAVLKKYRGTSVSLNLLKSMILLSRTMGLDYAVQSINPETHCLKESQAIIDLAKKKNFYDYAHQISLKRGGMNFSTLVEENCRDCGKDELPPFLDWLIRIGFRVMGPASLNQTMKMGAIPVIWDINNPSENMEHFLKKHNSNIRI